jgi:hypothetical protein
VIERPERYGFSPMNGYDDDDDYYGIP